MTKEDFLLKQRQEIVNKNVFKLKSEYKKLKKTVHCFYEGKDNVFYRGFVEYEYGNDFSYYFYIGNGKNTVYKCYERIIKNLTYNKNRVLFFTDKDVDNYISKPIIKDENIFETMYYSIENYLVNEDIFKRILTETYELEIEEEINYYKNLFNENLITFYKETQFISAWIIYNRQNEHNSPLKNVKMNDLFSFEHDNNNIRFSLNSDYKKHNQIHEYLKEKTKFSDDITLNISDIEAIKESLSGNPKNYTRGKFELWFFMEFLNTFSNKLILAYNKTIKDNGLDKTKLKADNTITNNERAMERFVAKLKIPSDIKFFLKLNYQKLN